MHALLQPLPLLSLLLAGGGPVPEVIPLDRAVNSGAVRVTGESLGGHVGECLSVELTNTTDLPLRTTIPAGWVMQNSEPEAQDLMIVDRLPVQLPPKGSSRVTCRAYCVESADRSPVAGTAMRSLGPASATWVKLAEYLSTNKRKDGTMQAAVWAVANGHDIAAIGAVDEQPDLALRKFVAQLTGRELPWYGKTYAPPSEDGRVFSDAATSIHGDIDFVLNTHGVVTVLVHNAQGQLIRAIGKDRQLGPGEYSMEVDLTVQGWPKGQYSIQFRLDGSRLLRRLTFVV